MSKSKIGLIFGGKSAEHEVSIMSAKSVIKAINKNKYIPTLFYISKEGQWYILDEIDEFISNQLEAQALNGYVLHALYNQEVILPVIHGPFGEDGRLQGFLETLSIPYVGSKVLASALCMDKILSKSLLQRAGLNTANFYPMTHNQSVEDEALKKWLEKNSFPVFVKPSNMGSSVGITKVSEMKDLKAAIHHARQFDTRVIIEQAIYGREIECAVLEYDGLKASGVGEVISSHDFYDYEAKYIDDGLEKMSIPAKNISEKTLMEIQELAIEAFKIHDCKGLARIDFFLEEATNRVVINEINTLPGMTIFSMYPALFEAQGISYENLIDRLIENAKLSF
jgi:D-alanine-D-alanine ligase